MNKTEKGVPDYCTPQSVEIAINPEGVLCSSFEKLNDEFNYTWEEE